MGFINYQKKNVSNSFLYWMILTTFLFSTLSISASNSTFLVDKIMLNQRYKSVRLGDVIKDIEKRNDCVFFFNSEIIDLDRKVTIDQENLSLKETLSKLFDNEKYEYTIEGRQIYISQKEKETTTTKTKQAPAKVTISGRVIDEIGEPLIGVSVVETGTSNGTITDLDGRYKLSVKANAKLHFAYIGYAPLDKLVGANDGEINISMTPEISNLDEVVVVGYRTQTKASLVGAVATLDMQQKERETITNTGQALYTASGLWVNQGGGQPGRDNVKIKIRGVNTIGNTDPLVLLDGIEYDINEIDPNNIESISVLKDAAAAIYGSKSTNGVILITSKSGKVGKPKVEYRGHFGFQQATYKPDVVSDPIMYMKMRNIAEVNAGKDPLAVSYGWDIIKEYEEGMKVDPTIYPSSNWMDIALRTAFMHQHNARVSGGNEGVTYSVGVGFMDQDGVFIANDNAKRYSWDIKLRAKINSRLNITASTIGNRRKFVEPGYGAGTIFGVISRALPIFSDYHKNGYYGSTWIFTPGRNNIENPRMEIEQGRITRDYQESLSKIDIAYKLPLDINYNMALGYRKIDHFSKDFVPEMFTINPKTGDVKAFNSNVPRVKDWDTYAYQFTISHRLQWEKMLAEKHLVHIMVGQDYQIDKSRNFQAYNHGFYTGDLKELNALKDQTNAQATGTSYRDRLNSFYSRLAYTYKNKYMLETTFRYDGSSRFRKGKQWTFYPSVLLGWRIDEEDFFNVEWIDGLKLRASAGKMGNQAVNRYSYKSTIDLNKDYNYSFGGSAAGGAAAAQIIDENIRWESTYAYNVGVDFVGFKNKLVLELDWFYKRTQDILRTVTIPSHIGGMKGPNTNVGTMDNKGFELTASYNDKIQDFTYGISGTLAYVNNKVVDVDGEVLISGARILKEGYPYNSFYLIQSDGYFQTYKEIDDAQAVYGGNKDKLRPGYMKYVNQNGDNIINEQDKVVVGNPIPKYTYSFKGSLGYKGFELTAQFQGVGEYDVYPSGNVVFPFNNGAGVLKDWATDSWTPENRNSKYPILATYTDARENYTLSTHWLQSAAYLRMKNIQLSYTLPKSITSKLQMENATLYVSGQNLVTWSSFKLWDPEISGDIGNLAEYPSLKTISWGINITF